jgi:hypothetical protein
VVLCGPGDQQTSQAAGTAKRSSSALTPEKVIGRIPRLDPLHKFQRYTGGFNVTNVHYWSVGPSTTTTPSGTDIWVDSVFTDCTMNQQHHLCQHQHHTGRSNQCYSISNHYNTQTQCRFTMINTKSDSGFVCTGGQSVAFTGIWAYTMAIVCLLCGVLLLVWQTYTSHDTSFKEEVLLPESKAGHRVPVCCVLQFGVLVLSASHPSLCSTSLLSQLLHRSPFTMKITVWNSSWTLSVLDQ